MRNRRTVVIAFLLIAVLLLGVGYAALTDILYISGTTTVSEDNAEDAFGDDIQFTSATSPQSGNTASIGDDKDGDTNDHVDLTVKSLGGKGDKATFTLTVENKGDLDAKISVKTLVNNDTANIFSVSCDLADDTPLANGASVTFTVTVELTATPSGEVSETFSIELEAVHE